MRHQQRLWRQVGADAPLGDPQRPVWLSNGLAFVGLIKMEMLFGLIFRSLEYDPVVVLDSPIHSLWKRRFHRLVGHERTFDLLDHYHSDVLPAPVFDRILEPDVQIEELLRPDLSPR